MTTLILGTKNKHKVEEIQQILGGQVRCLALSDFPGAPTPGEDQTTFEGNATQKAEEIAAWLRTIQPNKPELASETTFVLADDSGLEVDALKGAPGVYSARFANLESGRPGNSPDAENNAKLLQLLSGTPLAQRSARFRCVLALVPLKKVGAPVKIFSGSCEGRIAFEPGGSGGFGYDPLFIPNGHEVSFAELGPEVKNQLSHRNAALQQLKKHLGS
jgi:XTP/dITP diphosphohydrolase